MAATSRYSGAAGGRMARCQYLGEPPLTGDLFIAISMTEIDDADLGTEFLGDLTWTEYDGTYTRQQIDIVDILLGGRWKLRAAPTDFGTPGTPTAPGVAFVVYQGTTADPSGDATAHVIGWLQGPEVPYLPFTGDGATPLVITWPSGGTVLEGPNC